MAFPLGPSLEGTAGSESETIRRFGRTLNKGEILKTTASLKHWHR
jgi:hypothetical protein